MTLDFSTNFCTAQYCGGRWAALVF